MSFTGLAADARTSLSLEDVDEEKDGDDEHGKHTKKAKKRRGKGGDEEADEPTVVDFGPLRRLGELETGKVTISCETTALCGHFAHDVCIQKAIARKTAQAAFAVASKLRNDDNKGVESLNPLADLTNGLIEKLLPHVRVLGADKADLSQIQVDQAYKGLVSGLKEARAVAEKLRSEGKDLEADLLTGRPSCPRCDDFKARFEIDTSTPRYCKHVTLPIANLPGFHVSSKVQRGIEWVQSIPAGDKCLILSFFKAGLDMLEGALMHDSCTAPQQ